MSKPPTRQSKAESRRQLVFDLERHPFEALPLTQLYQVLTKRKPSWWASLDTNGGDGASGEGGASKIAAANDGTESAERRAVAEGQQRLIAIPETVVWEASIPKGWFSFDPKEGCVTRRKVETQQIQQAFLRGAQYENDVVAVTYSMPLSGDKDELQFRFLTASQLPAFLFENRRGKGTSILQKFVFPLTITHNDMIQAVWTPTVVQVNRRQNVNPIFDERVEVNERCATFEGRTHHSQIMHTTSRLRKQIEDVCNALAYHFRETDPKFAVSRMVLYFKMTDCSRLLLLFCTSARVLSTAVNASDSFLHRKFRVSLELATKFTLRETEDELLRQLDTNRHNSAPSVAADGKDADASVGAASPSPSQAFGRSGGKRASLLLALGTPSRREHALKMLEQQHEAERALQGRGRGGAQAGSDVASVRSIEPHVGDMKAARLGFLVRAQSPIVVVASSKATGTVAVNRQRGRASSAMARSTTSRSSTIGTGTGAGADRRRTAAGSVGGDGGNATSAMTVTAIVQDALRAERIDDPADETRAKLCKQLERCIEKVGQPVARAAYLGVKSQQGSGLDDPERMELLCLRLREHRVRSGSADVGSSEAVLERSFGLNSTLRAQAISPTVVKQPRQLVDGAAPDSNEVQERLLDISYEAQSHFACNPHDVHCAVLDPSNPADTLLITALVRLERAQQHRGVSARSTDSGEFVVADDDIESSMDAVALAGAALQFRLERQQRSENGEWQVVLQVIPQPRAAQLLHHIVLAAISDPSATRAAQLLREMDAARATRADVVPVADNSQHLSVTQSAPQRAESISPPSVKPDSPPHNRTTSGVSQYSDDFED